MRFPKRLIDLYEKIDEGFLKQTGFRLKETCLSKLVDYFYMPKDPSSLAVSRILFGLAMLFDIPDERGGSTMDMRWGNNNFCYFSLFYFLQPIPMPYMAIVYTAMWLGALGIMLGYKFRASCSTFALCYWYIILIEKSYWNNHSYLFGLVAILFIGTQANRYLSLDAYIRPSDQDRSVPYWNYFLLKYQFFVLYFVAGLKKGTAEWLSGYSLLRLSEHWVFDPFKFFMTVSQTDYLVVHWFAFIFDLTVAFWMMWAPTRHLAMLFCAAFHIMNIRLFRIGMFPWVCLATMPLFYPFDWPKIVYELAIGALKKTKSYIIKCRDETKNTSEKSGHDLAANNQVDVANHEDGGNQLANDKIVSGDTQQTNNEKHFFQRRITSCLILLYVAIQAFLPYSHFITKGYNNWTNGLYGYSWDMMVHSWDTVSVVVKVVDNDRNKEFYINPAAWTPNDRWTRHGDMVYQYAQCLRNNLIDNTNEHVSRDLDIIKKWQKTVNQKQQLKNISIYIDVWCSMNGRFQQRMFDPNIDLLTTNWSPFEKISWLMPLLVDAENWRNILDEIRNTVHSWNNVSDVLFVADFPGYNLENYISEDLVNITLSVLEGHIAYEPAITKNFDGRTSVMTSGDRTLIVPKKFHKVHNIGEKPAYYMYTFTNNTLLKNYLLDKEHGRPKEKLPIAKEVAGRFLNMLKFFNFIISSLFQIFFGCQCR